MKLRTFLTLAAVIAGVLGVQAAVTLLWTTTELSRAMAELGQAVESVHAAEELEIQLLLHERELRLEEAVPSGSREKMLQQSRATALEWLTQVEQHAGSSEEHVLVQRIRNQTEAYFSAPPDRRIEALRSAVQTAEALGEVNIVQARTLQERARRVDRFANRMGMFTAVVLVAGLATGIIAARRRLYGPLVTLRDALADYKRGAKGRRVPVSGPEELREIASEFNDMAGTLERQQELQLQFVAGVAHDLKNPLQALKMSAGMIARQQREAEDPKARQLTEKISKQADRLSRMVEDLLDRTRIEAGTLELRKERADLGDLATEVVELHRTGAGPHSLELELAPEPVTRPGSVPDS